VELLSSSSSSSSTRRLQPLFLPLRSGKPEASLETAAVAQELCFRGEEEKQQQGLEDVGNNNCDRNEEPELVGRLTFRELLSGAAALPDHLLQRVEELGFKYPTQVQKEALPVLLSGHDMILHAQTGSGKTLAYLLPMFSKVVPTRAAVQAIVVVPTRELGMQLPVGGKGSPHASWKKWRSSCRGNEYQEGEGKHYCDGIARWWN
jgi:ATP-dependent helicase YprA (DUF1998 family)